MEEKDEISQLIEDVNKVLASMVLSVPGSPADGKIAIDPAVFAGGKKSGARRKAVAAKNS
ncbi:MAG TPA: hypothetical protein DEE98_07185 [Elusimicrobia bacterium]|nr:MAG: hypothetical protein A2278_00180 [Elusimicrobia bacterium RIFOXYA12_FULL_49_49]OGS09483.1 MAG: hypothetical protein A2204_00535 [Elusimicrobia bacterium RIFOXYA1_FULL_47_7]OGS10638.1 MAG: hypothetical protein A2386_02820 [Elusimicrobia bacterium RIFOXYB1_FULL_48_9]OGS15853.1 MAG: hypothetical protein A2251_04315 [Elusimicrobia bacterium RIFOXYA2_FULL_47_53]OGS27147.1 MAG: hypothetical protein A2339_00565 [Elusimicrobia bacterium RIFOXYB12_FULL_50_12]OGS31185.1 MAG: hypothetical protein